MLVVKSKETETQEIYSINNLLKKYRINFYYSLRKDAVFLIEGRSVKERLNIAYTLSAIGAILFFFTLIYKETLLVNNIYLAIILPLAAFTSLAGIYILVDFYRKIKNNQTKTLIKRDGISFRDKNNLEFWATPQIKSIEVVFTADKKEVMKPGNIKKSIRKEGKIIVFNYLGQAKELLFLENPNRDQLINNLEVVAKTVRQFISLAAEKQLSAIATPA